MSTQRYACYRPGIGRAPAAHQKEAKRNVKDKSPITDDREKVGQRKKKVRNDGDVYEIGQSPSDGRQCPGRSPAIRHRSITDFSKTKKFRQLIVRF